jgi:hypothetical protein
MTGTHADISFELARLHLEQARAEAARERLATQVRRTAPDFIPPSRWRDAAFWSAIIGPLVAVGFLGYFAQEIIRAAA